MSDEMFLRWILPLIFLLIGLGLLCAAAWQVMRVRVFLRKAVVASGEVIALEEEPPTEPGDSCTYRPIISFTCRRGQQIQFESIVHSNPPQYKVGAKVLVLYDPDQPNQARIHSFISVWLLTVILGGLGLIFPVIGALLLSGHIAP